MKTALFLSTYKEELWALVGTFRQSPPLFFRSRALSVMESFSDHLRVFVECFKPSKHNKTFIYQHKNNKHIYKYRAFKNKLMASTLKRIKRSKKRRENTPIG